MQQLKPSVIKKCRNSGKKYLKMCRLTNVDQFGRLLNRFDYSHLFLTNSQQPEKGVCLLHQNVFRWIGNDILNIFIL